MTLRSPFFVSGRVPRVRLGHYLPDLVYGANDGIITTFAVFPASLGRTWHVP